VSSTFGATVADDGDPFEAPARVEQGALDVGRADELAERDVVEAQVLTDRERVEGVGLLKGGEKLGAHGPSATSSTAWDREFAA